MIPWNVCTAPTTSFSACLNTPVQCSIVTVLEDPFKCSVLFRCMRYKPSSAYFAEFRIDIEAVNDAPRVQLPGQVYHRNFSVVWPDTEEAEVVFTHPLFTDEDTPLDVPSVSISGKLTDSRHPKDHERTS